MRCLGFYSLIFFATILGPVHLIAADSCWNWYGEIKCSINTQGLRKGPETLEELKERCRKYPYLAENLWKDCKPYLETPTSK